MQTQIYEVSRRLVEQLPELLETLDIEYQDRGSHFAFPCPIHGGDNPTGCTIYKDNGIWGCWTHSCHTQYNKNIIGFVRGVLSANKPKRITIEEGLRWCLSYLGLNDIELEVESEKRQVLKDIKLLDVFYNKLERKPPLITRDDIRNSLEIPSKFYQDSTAIDRNFKAETLDLFDIGDCWTEGKDMYARAVAPIYDENDNYVGCIGRTLRNSDNKWKNSKGFEKTNFLYGLNFAKDPILETRTANLVEGQSCVWRLHEADFPNSVGIFGAELSDQQLLLLEMSGVMNLIILTDSDKAGNEAADKIIRKCGRRFNYIRPTFNTKDMAEMENEKLKIFLGEVYAKHNCPMWKKG